MDFDFNRGIRGHYFKGSLRIAKSIMIPTFSKIILNIATSIIGLQVDLLNS